MALLSARSRPDRTITAGGGRGAHKPQHRAGASRHRSSPSQPARSLPSGERFPGCARTGVRRRGSAGSSGLAGCRQTRRTDPVTAFLGRLLRPRPIRPAGAEAATSHTDEPLGRHRPRGRLVQQSGKRNADSARGSAHVLPLIPHAVPLAGGAVRPRLVPSAAVHGPPQLPQGPAVGYRPSVPCVLGPSTRGFSAALRPRRGEVTGLRAHAACPGTDALPRRQPLA